MLRKIISARTVKRLMPIQRQLKPVKRRMHTEPEFRSENGNIFSWYLRLAACGAGIGAYAGLLFSILTLRFESEKSRHIAMMTLQGAINGGFLVTYPVLKVYSFFESKKEESNKAINEDHQTGELTIKVTP